MKRLLIINILVFLVIGVIGCAPSQSVKEVSTAPTTEEKRLEAEKYYSIGYEYLKQGKFDEAIANFDTAIELWPQFYAAYIALAQTYRAKRDIMATETQYMTAKKIDQNDPRTYEGLGALYTELQRYGDAINEYEGGLKVDATNVNLLNGLGYVYMKTKEYDKSLSYYYKSLEYEPENLITIKALADVYIEKGEPDKAVGYYRDLVKKKPKNTEVRKKFAETLVDLKRYDEAVEQYEYLLAEDPDNVTLLLQCGLAYQRVKKYSAAREKFTKARQLEPDNPLPVLYLADLNIAQRRYAAAENLVKEALKLDPSSMYGQILLGDIYLRRGSNARDSWLNDKSKKNCPTLNSAITYLRTAISHYTTAKTDNMFSAYAKTEITRCNNWIEQLSEDKWFYCK